MKQKHRHSSDILFRVFHLFHSPCGTEQEFRVFTLCKVFSDITISLLENEIKIVYLHVVFGQQTYRKRLAFYSLSESGQFACRKAHKYNGNKGYRLHWLFLGFSLAIAESVSRESYPLYGSPEPAQIRCQVGPRFLFIILL